ncbi:hypothetical protein DL93DRAFT_2079858 [Clavulina sp. PMI_390]|nr:hypothetical protein DL93DRAFT_2079858 [Clavulina sp. PMI_390]
MATHHPGWTFDPPGRVYKQRGSWAHSSSPLFILTSTKHILSITMGWFDDNSHQAESYDTVTNKPHEAKWTHELIAGAAAFEAAKKYNEHVAQNGAPPSHAKAKELLAGFAGAFVDRMVETKGLDFIDKQKAKHQAQEHANEALVENHPDMPSV